MRAPQTLSPTVTVLLALLTAVVVVGAAVIAAITARKNLRDQLAADERKQVRDHAQERALNDLAELRTTLDAVAAAVTATAFELAHTSTVLERQPHTEADAHKLVDSVTAALGSLSGESLRVALRLGYDAPAYGKLEACLDDMAAIHGLLLGAPWGVKGPDNDGNLSRFFQRLYEHREAYIAESRNLIGSRLDTV